MDLSDFTKTLNYMPDLVRYFDEETKEDKTAKEVELTWKHNSLHVSELKFYLREGHEAWEDKIRTRENEILTFHVPNHALKHHSAPSARSTAAPRQRGRGGGGSQRRRRRL